ncbi:MAG TPA: hypothetical protein PKM43_11825 [Verrucomicrobiota bacterium]|nr:hypothetical protein [Verrucomicrobiota bacterium]
MNGTTTYRSWVFASFYFGVLVFFAAIWSVVTNVPAWGVLLLVAFGVLGLPWFRARVEISDEGITQQIFGSRSVRWADIVSWRRVSHPDSDGPDTITINTRAGSFSLSHNCVFGKRLDVVESELRRRIAQPNGAGHSHRAGQ